MRSISSVSRTVSRSPCAAAAAIRTSASVVPDIADSTVSRAPSEVMISATRRMLAAEPTDVPPNFSVFIMSSVK